MKLKPKHIVLSLLAAGWIGGGIWAAPWLAGGVYLGLHKTDPRTAERSTWREYWDDYQDVKAEKKKLQAAMGIAVFGLFGLPLIAILANAGKGRSLHGDARWATYEEIKGSGLMADNGLILGKYGSKFLMLNEPKFVLLIAPTRSGKGVGTIIPNLLNWGGSTIVVDIKGENYAVTSGFRAKHGQAVYKFAPFGEESATGTVFETHGFNPLSYVSSDPRFAVGDLQGLGYMLYPKDDGQAGFWNDQARNLFVAVSLYCMEAGYPVTMGEVLRRSSGLGKPKEFWQGIVESGKTPEGKQLSEDCLNGLRQFVGNSDNTLTSILSSFNAPLGIFANPSVDAATSCNDFDLRDVRRRRMSVYVVIPPNRLSEAALLVNLFFSIAIDQNTKVLPEHDPTLKVKCLLVLDEFPALGRVDKFVKSVGYIAGYGLRALTIAQSMSQLKSNKLYGPEEAENLATNHLVKIVYAPQEQKDAQEYSDLLGFSTEKGLSKGRSWGAGKPGRSENESDQRRALMLPQELREMGADRVIVLSDTCKPIFADKIRYYSDKAFSPGRILPAFQAPRLDVDLHIARRERRMRDLKPGEQVAPGSLVLSDVTLPPVTDQKNPIPEEVARMAEVLFGTINWTKDSPKGDASAGNSSSPAVQVPEQALEMAA